MSKSRSRPLTTARHVAMYLLRELTGLSLIKIGEHFDRDHTTALHGIKKIEGLMPARGSTYRQVQELTKKIPGSRAQRVHERWETILAACGLAVPTIAEALADCGSSPARPHAGRVIRGGYAGRTGARPLFPHLLLLLV